ncbi:MAG: tetratricopeptide repeat protein [Phycisphaerae bacterium]|jgi:tetratricopeptide (TPR) repeat protein|nr:tetratricopeptide repeat protein [Phycisphaerae bacterium]
MTKQSTGRGGACADRSRKTLKLVLAGVLCATIVVAIALIRQFTGQNDHAAIQTDTRPAESRPAEALTVAALKKEAIDSAMELMNKHPNRVDPIVLMGGVCSQQGNTAEAVKWWRKALELDPKREDACRSIGEIEAKQGDYEKAEETLRKAVEMDPKAPLAYEALGRTLMKLNRIDQAVSLLLRGTEACPESGRVALRLAQAHLQARAYDKARKSYETAIGMDLDLTQFPKAYYGLSTACARLGLRDDAEKYREKFKQAREAHDKAHMDWRRSSYNEADLQRRNVSQTCTHIGGIYMSYGDPREAERFWLRAASLDRRNTQCLTRLAELYSREFKRYKALAICEEIREVEPTNALNYLSIGFLHQQLKQFDKAEDAFKKVIQFAPKRTEGRLALARMYMKTNRMLPQAKELATEAAKLKPTGANYFFLSEACAKCGDTEGRRKALKRAVELEPDNMNYKLAYEMIRVSGS